MSDAAHPSAQAAPFAGRRALVTGANSGIGLEVCRRLLALGATIIATDLVEGDGLSQLQAAGAVIHVGDLRSPAVRASLVEMTANLDILVNSAGVMRLRPMTEITEADWDLVMDVNTKAVFFLTQELTGRLTDGATIVNVSSMAARRAVNSETVVYAASKAALLSLTRSQAHALAPRRIRVNAVLPGLIDTPMQQQVIADTAAARGVEAAELGEARAAEIPLGRLGAPLDVADAVLWLASPESAYLTGQSIAVDGGLTMY